MNNKPIIGVDVDGVLNDYAAAFVALSNKLFGTALSRDDFSEDFQSVWQSDIEETTRRLDILNHEFIWDKGTEQRLDAYPVLKALAKDYRLVIVTSRQKQLFERTKNMAEQSFPGIFSEIYHVGLWDKFDSNTHKKTKGDFCQQIGVSYLIDDQPKHCNSAAERGITCLLFGDESWNRNVPISPNVTRVADWPTVKQFFANK